MPRPALLYALHSFIIAAPGRYSSVFLSARGLSVSRVGTVLALPNALSLLALAPVAAAADRGGARSVLRTGFSVSTAALAVLALLQKAGGWGGFLLTALLFAVFKVARSPAHPVLDAYGLEWLRRGTENVDGNGEGEKERKMLFGRERMWGSISMGFWSVVIGFVADRVGYNCTLYFNIVATVCMLVLIQFFWDSEPNGFIVGNDSESGEVLDDEEGTSAGVRDHLQILNGEEENPTGERDDPKEFPGEQRMSALEFFLVSVREPRSAMFLFTCVAISVGTSLVDDLLFLFLVGDLKASNVLCGVALAVTVIFEIPLLYWSSTLLGKFGAQNLMVLGMASYAFRVEVYTILDKEHAWYILLVEPLHGVTYALVQVARVQEASEFAPPHLQATAQSLVAISSTLGSLAGTLGGSYMMQAYGSVFTYRCAAALVLFSATLYYASTVLLVQRSASSENERQEESWGVIIDERPELQEGSV